MARYFIKDIENISGIKAHTIRIWEQRYNLISPKRTQTNLRFYNDEDVKLILNVSILKDAGYRISDIAALNQRDLMEKVNSVIDEVEGKDSIIKSLVASTYDLNEGEINKTLSSHIIKNGFEATVLDLIFPFLKKIGQLWMSNSLHPGLEHFATNIIKNKLQIAAEGKQIKNYNAKKFLLFLPEGEHHEISLLFASYLLKASGHEVVYMGSNTPMANLPNVFKDWLPDYIFTSITTGFTQLPLEKMLSMFEENWSSIKVFMTGSRALEFKGKIPENVQILKDVSAFKSILEKL